MSTKKFLKEVTISSDQAQSKALALMNKFDTQELVKDGRNLLVRFVLEICPFYRMLRCYNEWLLVWKTS